MRLAGLFPRGGDDAPERRFSQRSRIGLRRFRIGDGLLLLASQHFPSKVRTRRVLGFAEVDLTCNAIRLEWTELDIRRDDMEYYCVTAQATGDSTVRAVVV
jgi:hypothetical protein